MEFIHIVELLSAVLAMGGAFYMAEGKIVKGFAFFLVSNMGVIVVSFTAGLIPLFVQMILFTISGLIALRAVDKDSFYKIYPNLLGTLIVIVAIAYFTGTEINSFSYDISGIEILAAVLAVSGNLFMAGAEGKRVVGFTLFILADILYLKIGLGAELFFFTIQTAYFLVVSGFGIKKILKSGKEIVLC